ncbi:MAG: hypothetical protein V3T42_00430 [Nitrospirales bacterium]|jgi:hypothetical protein
MEIILVIFLTGLGLLGGMFFIWKGDHHSASDERLPSPAKDYIPRERKKQVV